MEAESPPPSRLSYGPVYHQLGRRLRKFSKKIDPLLISAGMLNHQITAGRLDGIFIILTDSPDSDCESWANNHHYVHFGKTKHIQKMTILGENCQWHSHKPEVFVWHIKEIIFFRKSEHLDSALTIHRKIRPVTAENPISQATSGKISIRFS